MRARNSRLRATRISPLSVRRHGTVGCRNQPASVRRIPPSPKQSDAEAATSPREAHQISAQCLFAYFPEYTEKSPMARKGEAHHVDCVLPQPGLNQTRHGLECCQMALRRRTDDRHLRDSSPAHSPRAGTARCLRRESSPSDDFTAAVPTDIHLILPPKKKWERRCVFRSDFSNYTCISLRPSNAPALRGRLPCKSRRATRVQRHWQTCHGLSPPLMPRGRCIADRNAKVFVHVFVSR